MKNLQNVFETSGVKSVVLNERIIFAFCTRLYRIVQSIFAATKKGSTTFNVLLSKWKSDPKAQWKIKIYYSEMEIMTLRNENVALNKRKRKLETDLVTETAKRRKTEEILSCQKEVTKKPKMQLIDVVQKLLRKSKTKGPSAKKVFQII